MARKRLAGYVIVYQPLSHKLLTNCYVSALRPLSFTTDIQEAFVFGTSLSASVGLGDIETVPEGYLPGTLAKVYSEATLSLDKD